MMDYKKEMKNDMKKYAREMTDLSESVFKLTAQLPNDQSSASEKDLNRKILDILNGRRPPNVSYDDGDQSPLSGESAQYLKNQWSTGMDCVPFEPRFHYLSSWLKVIYSGDYDSMMKMLENKSEAEIKRMLDRRESLMNISAIFHVVVGARTLAEKHPDLADVQRLSEKNLTIKNEHIKILEKLLNLGADVNVRDVAGFSPLHYCAQFHGNKTTLKMAEILIKAGAKVDAQNRFGSTPLMDSTIAQRYDLVKFFTKLGADLFLKDHDGSSPFSLSQYNQKMLKIFSEARKKNACKERERLREEAGGSFKNCSVCGSTENTKLCTGCFFVWYCSTQCQKKNWGEHKENCKKIQSEYLVCRVKQQTSVLTASGKVYFGNERKPPKKHFVVKVQIPMNRFGGIGISETGAINVQNKDRSYMAFIEKQENEIVHTALMLEVERNGVNGLKGYFYAFIDSNNKLKINPSRILPPETW